MARKLSLVVVLAALAAAGCGGGGDDEEAGAPEGGGDPGARVYAEAGCGGCHTLEEAGSTAMIGPPLDDALKGDTAEQIRESIVSPDAEISPGFSPGVMPQDFGEQLSEQELSDLVAFLQNSAG